MGEAKPEENGRQQYCGFRRIVKMRGYQNEYGKGREVFNRINVRTIGTIYPLGKRTIGRRYIIVWLQWAASFHEADYIRESREDPSKLQLTASSIFQVNSLRPPKASRLIEVITDHALLVFRK